MACSAGSTSTGTNNAEEAGASGAGGADNEEETPGAGSSGSSGESGSAGSVDIGDGGVVKSDAKLLGRVLAPEGTIPISGALVYLTTTPPPPLPTGVYCDKCVELSDSTPHTFSAPDGTFELPSSSGNFYIVVQKGAFRRIRSITVGKGDQPVPNELTTMPSIINSSNGDETPRIAVIQGAWDPIEVVLARMGLKAKITKDFLGRAQVLPQDAPAFKIYSNSFDVYKLLQTPSELAKYQIIFLPCSGGVNDVDSGGPKCSSTFTGDSTIKKTLEEFVRNGGRIYSSDWTYEYIRQTFQGFVSWQGETKQIGSACDNGGGSQSASTPDEGLTDWLGAQSMPLTQVHDAWTYIKSVNTTQGPDENGQPISITPKVWVQAGQSPAAASFKYGCGRVLYSTYHTQPSSEVNGPLEPQALSLLYMILEVGVCISPGDVHLEVRYHRAYAHITRLSFLSDPSARSRRLLK